MTTFDEIKEIFSIKRIIASLLAVLMLFSSVVKGGKLGKAEISVIGEVTTESKEINLEIRNYSVREVGFGEDFSLEMVNNDEWENVPICGYFYEPYIIMNRFGVLNQKIDIEKMFGKNLEAGEYRITKMIKVGSRSNFEPYTAYFTVTEAPAQESPTVPAA